jgi:mono/diheme cytochrome c family protein
MKAKIIFGLLLVVIIVITSCQSEDQLEFARYYSSGNLTYQNKCQNCHGKSGEGLGELIPPLTDTAWLKTHKNSLPCIVKNGFSDTITINQKKFAEKMPAVELSPVEIAGVLTYVTNSFGGKGGTVTTQRVEKNLGKCK